MEGSIIYNDGDIFSPNRTGHECVVCHLVSSKGVLLAGVGAQIHKLFPDAYKDYVRACSLAAEPSDLLGKVLFYGVKHNGFDYNIASIFGLNDANQGNDHTNLDSLRKAMEPIRVMATPLPARTLTTVRIPYKFGFDLTDDEWENIYRMIQEELIDQGIPVEIWKTNVVPTMTYNRHQAKERARDRMTVKLTETQTDVEYRKAQYDIALRLMLDNVPDEKIRQYTKLPMMEIEAIRIHSLDFARKDRECKSRVMMASFHGHHFPPSIVEE